jgi:hypothetical protein
MGPNGGGARTGGEGREDGQREASMATVEAAIASFERNIEAQTGRSVEAWASLVAGQGLEKHGQMVAWLKGEHGLSHAHANHIAKRATAGATAPSGDDPVAPLFAGPKQGLRPLYDRLVAAATALGNDVEIAPKKANVSLRRRKQFALVQPSTAARLDLGLILKSTPAEGRLEASGSFNAMFTHRVRLSGPDDLDDEVLGWLRRAYAEAL